ncbi:hypothetical protein CUMW_026930 [Citrus unshiu]|nr:hypothetical protein CUMW_026930 [Citrus unshiu]
MDYNHQRKVSLLEGEDFFFNKVLSRGSSVGCSSRELYYISNTEGVPFKWEMQPGKPKEPPKEDIIPPLSPPPAVLSLGLPKPAIEEPPSNNKASILKSIKLMFWKQNRKGQGVLLNKNKYVIQKGSNNSNKGSIDHVNDFSSSEEPVNFEYYSSDDIGEEFTASSRNSSSSSSNYSSFSFCNNNNNNAHHSSQSSSRVQSPAREQIDGVFYGGCSKWRITSVLARVARRI